MSAREVVSQAGRIPLGIADRILAALAADPGTVERAARALVPPMANPLGLADANWAHYRNLARAVLAAALTPEAAE